MSYVNTEILKGNLDPTLPFFTSSFAFTTAAQTIDSLSQFGAYIKAFRIVNNDVANPLSYIQGSPLGISKNVPLSSEVVVSGWESFLKVTPNAVTGSGYIELDLILRSSAEKQNRG